MDTRDLKYFVVIAEEKNISKAAERLFVAQPTLSQFLNKFEKEVGSKLFIRMGRGVRLTYAGEVFLRYATHILTDFHRAQGEVNDIENLNSGMIIFGISPYRGSGLFPPILRKFNERYPNIRLEIIEDDSFVLERLTASGRLDMALVGSNTALTKVEYVPYKKDEVIIIANKAHPILQYANPATENTGFPYVAYDDFVKYGFLLGKSDTILGQVALEEFAKCKKQPPIISRNLNAFFAASLADKDVGLALTYASCSRLFPNAKFLSLGPDGRFIDLYLAYPKNNYKSKAVQAFTNLIFELEEQSENQHQT
jgi:DNA-binding transcriptional LysR family regulator